MRAASLGDAARMDLVVRHPVIPHRRRRCRDLASQAGENVVREDPDTLRVRDDNGTRYHQYMTTGVLCTPVVINPS